MKCRHKDCPCDAVAAPAINVPAMNMPIHEHDPIHVVLGMPLCLVHLDQCRVDDFLVEGGDLEKMIRIRARGSAEPDFKRAWISRVEFDSEEWRILATMNPKNAQ